MIAENHPAEVCPGFSEAAAQAVRELKEQTVLLYVLKWVPPHCRLRQGPLPGLDGIYDHVPIADAGWDVAGKGVDLCGGVTKGAGRYPDGAFETVGDGGCGHRRPKLLVPLHERIPNLLVTS